MGIMVIGVFQGYSIDFSLRMVELACMGIIHGSDKYYLICGEIKN